MKNPTFCPSGQSLTPGRGLTRNAPKPVAFSTALGAFCFSDNSMVHHSGR